MPVVSAGSGRHFDRRRNTSRPGQPNLGAGAAYARHVSRYRCEDWYRWVIAYGKQEHLHDTFRADRSTAACPVYGCDYGRTRHY